MGHNGPKVLTIVKFGAYLTLSNGVEYEVQGVINHWGGDTERRAFCHIYEE